MAKWNDTDVPIAYLVTFRTYGTWLAGDERGSIDRFHNTYGSARVSPNPMLEQQHAKRLKGPPVKLDAQARRSVEAAIREVCAFRNWKLYSLSVRTNHAHTVVAAVASADRVLNDLKPYATRRMRTEGCWDKAYSPWVDKGSTRWLWTEDHIIAACEYVTHGQGDPLPDFD
ncbi:MAG: hypothetical protein WBO10_11645 [Pyrinomonadaceae bacterium]